MYLLLIALLPLVAHAQPVEYSPEFVDTFLVQTADTEQVASVLDDLDMNAMSEAPEWDVQHLRARQYFPSLLVFIPVVLLLIILLKFSYKNFFLASLSGIVNDKVFHLHYRGKKFSENLPVVFFYLIRLMVITMIVQYCFYYFLNDNRFISLRYFLLSFVIVFTFYALKNLSEWLIQGMIGTGEAFRMYFVQQTLITGWLWLPALLAVLVLYLNNVKLPANWMLGIVVLPVLFSSIFAVIRGLLLWKAGWRDNFIYFFIYLCTFKFIPYLVLAKWVSNHWVLFR